MSQYNQLVVDMGGGREEGFKEYVEYLREHNLPLPYPYSIKKKPVNPYENPRCNVCKYCIKMMGSNEWESYEKSNIV